MTARTLVTVGFLAAGTVALVATACRKNDDGRSLLIRPPAAPTGPLLTDVAVDGPPTVSPGETVPFTATATFNDGTSRDVSSEGTWSSSNSSVLQASGNRITGVAPGAANVFVNFAGVSRGRSVFVLPTGTFRLLGNVHETGFIVPSATVTVEAGTGAGLTTITTSGGAFTFYGVAGPIRLRATKAGYAPVTTEITVITHDQRANIEIRQESIPQLSGTYVMNVRAGTCSEPNATLPVEAMARTYTAEIRQNGPSLEVVVSGAEFFNDSPKFTGRITPDAVTFSIYGPDNYYYGYSPHRADIIERLSSTRLLIVSGEVRGSATGTRISGTLNGLVRVVNGSTPTTATRVDCFSPRHQFELQR